MTVSVFQAEQGFINKWFFEQPEINLDQKDRDTFERCFLTSTELWVGLKDSSLVCIWGLAPPTLLSDQAYLWLYTTPSLTGNEFVFVRHSQRAVEKMLERYPTIVGHTTGDSAQTMRWLRWLGARFGDFNGRLIPFTIRKRAGG